MPGFDGTGPAGQGAMSGRGMGRCNNANRPATGKFASRGMCNGSRKRLGCGNGNGFGRKHNGFNGAGRGISR